MADMVEKRVILDPRLQEKKFKTAGVVLLILLLIMAIVAIALVAWFGQGTTGPDGGSGYVSPGNVQNAQVTVTVFMSVTMLFSLVMIVLAATSKRYVAETQVTEVVMSAN